MTTLLLDAGNTRLKWALLSAGGQTGLRNAASLEYARLREFGAQLGDRPERILGSNVAGGHIADTLGGICRSRWGLDIRWCGTSDGTGMLDSRYDSQAQLGTDRWLGMLGLLSHVRRDQGWLAGCPALLASFGTATTIDTMAHVAGPDAHRRATFMGGVILPGPTLMAQTLARHTAQLPMAQGEYADFPGNTQDAITSGILAAQFGALLHQWRLAARLGNGDPRIYVSGGAWQLVGRYLPRLLEQAQAGRLQADAVRFIEHPVLDGLARLASQQQAHS